MNLRNAVLSVVATSSLLLAAAAAAQPATEAPHAPVTQARADQGTAQLADRDRSFLENAAQAGHAEIEGSQLAGDSEASAEVQAFARRMIDDHSRVNDELTQLASGKGVTLPGEPSLTQRTELLALRALSGGPFDTMYAARIGVAAHENTVELFREAARTAEDPEVRAFAEKQLPDLERHLEMARELREKVGD